MKIVRWKTLEHQVIENSGTKVVDVFGRMRTFLRTIDLFANTNAQAQTVE